MSLCTTSQAAINTAVSLGATVIVAAGNSSENVSNSSPANCANVVTVAAVGRTGGRASYSNFGSLIDIAAPGGDQLTGTTNGVLSTLNSGSDAPSNDTYAYYQGTSMATPHVAGAAALLYSLDPSITPSEVESLLKSTARSFPSTCNSCGDGIVDATAAVEALISGNVGGGDDDVSESLFETGLSASRNSFLNYSIEVPSGASRLSVQISGGSGDADLYVNFGSTATTSTYDCRPFLNGNTELCTFDSPAAGTWYIGVDAFAAFSNLTLEATVD